MTTLQERTLVVKNFDPDRTTDKLLKELCLQGGPVKNVVVRPDHAFVEFEDVESVGYTKALLDGVELFGKRLSMEPKLREPRFYTYNKLLNDYVNYSKWNKQQQEMQSRMQQQLQFQQQQQQHPAQSHYMQMQQQFVQMPQQHQLQQQPHFHVQYQPPNQAARGLYDKPYYRPVSYGNKRRR